MASMSLGFLQDTVIATGRPLACRSFVLKLIRNIGSIYGNRHIYCQYISTCLHTHKYVICNTCVYIYICICMCTFTCASVDTIQNREPWLMSVDNFDCSTANSSGGLNSQTQYLPAALQESILALCHSNIGPETACGLKVT